MIGRKAIFSLLLTASARTEAKTGQEFAAIRFSDIYDQSQITSLDIKIKAPSDINQHSFIEVNQALLIGFWWSGPSVFLSNCLNFGPDCCLQRKGVTSKWFGGT